MASVTIVGLRDPKTITDLEQFKSGRLDTDHDEATYLANLSVLGSSITARLVSSPELEIEAKEVEFFPLSCLSYPNHWLDSDKPAHPESLNVRIVFYTDKAGRNRKNLDRAAQESYDAVRDFAMANLPDTYNWVEVTAEVFGTINVGHWAGPVLYK